MTRVIILGVRHIIIGCVQIAGQRKCHHYLRNRMSTKDVTQKYIFRTAKGQWKCYYCKFEFREYVSIKFLIRQQGWKVIQDESDHSGIPPYSYWMCFDCWLKDRSPLFREE